MPDILLGEGSEGRVYRRGDEVVKYFHDGVISDATGCRLAEMAFSFGPPFPEGVRICKEDKKWLVRYPWFDSEPVYDFTKEEVMDYLVKAGKLGVIADNFKPTNLRRRDGHLVHVDIGRHIRAFNRSTFRDVCAKAYALLQGMSEDQLVTGFEAFRQSGGVDQMHGFMEFHADVVGRIMGSFWGSSPRSAVAVMENDVTLLIKCCAMDSGYLERQVGHIVHRLSYPRKFREVVLSIDAKVGAFLRQHTSGDLEVLRSAALRLRAQGVIDSIVEAPDEAGIISAASLRWFGVKSQETHTASGIPVYPQIWAFEQVKTRYVLQADCDVLICRADFSHDFLSEMLAAHAEVGVMGVGFNIPKPPHATVRPYEAPVGEFKPEVRLGLFDLIRLRAALPLPNKLFGEHLHLGWYQALHRALGDNGWRCLRGGDPRTTYIHPLNSAKRAAGFLGSVRRCVESGYVPEFQCNKWDLVEDDAEWVIPRYRHGMLVVLRPTHATQAEIKRCVGSLAGQEDRQFEIAVLEDLDRPARTAEVMAMLNILGLNAKVMSMEEVCGQPGPKINGSDDRHHHEATVLMLGLDEALMAADAIGTIKAAVVEAGGIREGCLCDAEGLRRSSRFGLGQMYQGELTQLSCLQPRCFSSSFNALQHAMTLDYHPGCTIFDAFSETPPSGGNLRPSVMGGFVVWRDQRKEVET